MKTPRHLAFREKGSRAIRASAQVRTAKRRRELRKMVLPVGKPVRTEEIHGSSEVLADRHEDCEHYSGCLTFAVRQGWDGFACGGCGDFVPGDSLRRSADGIVTSVIAEQREDE